MRANALPALALLALLSAACAMRAPLPPARAAPPFPHALPPPARHVDDVGVALTNATATALHRARAILARYSDTLRVVAIPTGLAVSFFGYFLLSPVLFLAAFVSGGGACFVAVNTILGEDTPAAAWISIAAMLLGGALLGFLALHALNFGMFAVGAALGVVLVSAVKTTLIAEAYPKDPRTAFIVVAVVSGLILGLLAVCLQKHMLIFSTAYAGSCACMFGIGYFAGHFPTTEDLSNVEAGSLDAWVLLYIGLTLVLGTAGMFFQFWLARGKPMPEHAPRDRRNRRRRLRQHDYDDMSDDDDWADDVYIERVPLPRRKREPSRVRGSVSSEKVVYQRPKEERPTRTRTTESQTSWDNVKSAAVAFDVPSATEDIYPSHKVANNVSETPPSVPRAKRTIPQTVELFDLSDSHEPVDMRHHDDAPGKLEPVPLGSDAENLAKV